ncbi:peptidoglycan editing factor PgeF [Devosia chinhatensis]|uniref:peptidoglycan editing factor PgeF n=1 Tax=Devosia chinhatensis TaxID=429727 RepID=UPI001AEC45D9|nr:peptidoglycan editing factor PgeF [Devosia chinhatensis]
MRHGFFGRAGGVSTGEFASLNVSAAIGDDPDLVAQNRALVERAVGAGALAILKQVHSSRVAILDQVPEASTIAADAAVTATRGIGLAILTADCTPILLADPIAGVLGAAHAGWRGAVDGIIGNTVEAMLSLGAKREDIRVAYGPTISGPNYEVGEQFRADFLALHPGGAHHFDTPDNRPPHFDLPGFVEEQLHAAGIDRVEQVGACTYAHPDRYFSHRYATHNGTRTGRQIAVIGMT